MSVVELAACQVFVREADYGSEEAFDSLLERIGARLGAARARTESGAFTHPCLAVFPEMIGAMLPLVGQLDVVRGATTTDGALARIALRQPLAIARAMAHGRRLSPSVGFLLANGAEARRRYRDAFARFARRHDAWVVAGSALLPANAHGDLAERFEPEGGRVYNTSYAFAPDGRLVGCTRKVNLVPEVETGLGLTPGEPGALEPIATPFGPVATLICYDGFRVAHTAREPGFVRLGHRCDALGAVVLAHPAANPWPWDEPFRFGGRRSGELRRDEWRDEGIFAQLAEGGYEHVRYAVTAQLLGTLFDNHFDGRSQILERHADGVRVLAEAARADASLASEEVVVRAVALP